MTTFIVVLYTVTIALSSFIWYKVGFLKGSKFTVETLEDEIARETKRSQGTFYVESNSVHNH